MTAQQLAERLLRKSTKDLLAALDATPEERARWRAEGRGRTIWQLAVEVGAVHGMWSRIFEAREWIPPTQTLWDDAEARYDTLDLAKVELVRQTEELIAVIRALTAQDLELTIPVPSDPKVKISLAECLFHPYWNAVYHEGQIALLQTQYGDAEEHGDPGPFGA